MSVAHPPAAPSGPGVTRRRYMPALATIVIPGLGHLVAGRTRLAALFGLPLVLFVGIGAGLLVATNADEIVGFAIDDPS